MEIRPSNAMADVDAPLRAAATKGLPIRIRVQPSIYKAPDNPEQRGNQRAWPGVGWNFTCGSVDEAQALRETLRTFFEVLARDGILATRERLQVTTAAA